MKEFGDLLIIGFFMGVGSGLFLILFEKRVRKWVEDGKTGKVLGLVAACFVAGGITFFLDRYFGSYELKFVPKPVEIPYSNGGMGTDSDIANLGFFFKTILGNRYSLAAQFVMLFFVIQMAVGKLSRGTPFSSESLTEDLIETSRTFPIILLAVTFYRLFSLMTNITTNPEIVTRSAFTLMLLFILEIMWMFIANQENYRSRVQIVISIVTIIATYFGIFILFGI